MGWQKNFPFQHGRVSFEFDLRRDAEGYVVATMLTCPSTGFATPFDHRVSFPGPSEAAQWAVNLALDRIKEEGHNAAGNALWVWFQALDLS